MASVGGRRSPQVSSDESFHMECSPCKYEGVKAVAKHFCPECGDYLCESCRKTHQGLSITRNHQLVSGNKMPKKGEKSKKDLDVHRLALCSCNAEEVTTYCEDHNKVMCANCKLLQHRICKTVDISQKCTDIETGSSETNTAVLELKEKLETLQKTRNEDMQELASQGDRAQETVKTFRQELDEQLDRMEKQSLADIVQCVREQKCPIQDHIDAVGAALNKLELDNNQYQAARSINDKRISFIQNLQLSKTMSRIKSVVDGVSKEVKKPNVFFECDQSLTLNSTPSLGQISSVQTNETGKAVGEMTVISTTQNDVRIPADTTDPLISGSAFMPSGELVLCDHNNRNLKVLKVDLRLKENITLPSPPWDLSVMNKDEVVITLPDINYLLFVTVYPTLQCGSSIQFDQPCRSVQVNGNDIYVLFDTGKIRIIDRAGTQRKNIYSRFIFSSCLSCVDISSTGMLCVSEHTTQTIRGFHTGGEIYNYTDPLLQSPLGVYIDGHQNVLACGFSSNNIHVIDKSGKQIKILLSANDGVSEPYALSFRQSDDTLVVAGGGMKLLVCKMQ